MKYVYCFILSLLSMIFLGCTVDAGGESGQTSISSASPIVIGDGSGSVTPGDKASIRWQVTADQPSTVFIEASYDGGKTWVLVESNVVNSGSYDFSVLDIPGAEFRLRIVGTGEDSVLAESEDITVEGTLPSVSIAGDPSEVKIGESVELSWTPNADHPSSVTLQYSINGGTTFTTIESFANTGSHTYTVGNFPGSSLILQVIDSEKNLVLARSGAMTVKASGYPGLVVSSSGGVVKSNSFTVHGVVGEVVHKTEQSGSSGTKVQVNFIGVTK